MITSTKAVKNILGAILFLLVSTIFTTQTVIAQSSNSSTSDVFVFSYVDKNQSTNQSFNQTAVSRAKVSSEQEIEKWKIGLNNQIRDLGEGDTLNIPLPSGDVLSAIIDVRNNLKNGDIQFQASIGGNGGIVLTVSKDVMFASIISVDDDINMSIGLDANQEQMLIDQNTLPLDAVDLSDDMVELAETTSNGSIDSAAIAQATNSGNSNLDILFVYSAEFTQLFSSAETRINQLVGFTNLAYDNSGILINMRVAGAIELNINNDDTTSNLLFDAQANVNGFESINDLRNQFGADLVAVLTTRNDFSSDGIAFVITGNFQGSGFSSTKLSLNCCDLVFAHEIGHNLGSSHERTSVNPDQSAPCTGGFTGFSCGHGILDSWGTLMTSSSRLDRTRAGNIFSNLNSSCLGEPCGIAAGEAGSADNQTSFNQTRLTISQFRDEIISIESGINSLPAIYDLLLSQ